MPRRDRNRLLCNDFQCVRQFAFVILWRRLGPAAVMPSAQGFYHAVVEPRSRLAREQPQR